MVHKDIKATAIEQLKKVPGMEAAAQGTEEKNCQPVIE